MVWLVAGVMTIAGALAYGELAAMMPQAGGQYVYLREAYGGMWAFMFGWTLLLVIQTGTIAAVAVAFARFAGVMWPVLGSNLWIGAGGAGLSGERAGAIAVIAVLTAANLRGLNMGKWLQNSFTTAKILSLCLIVVVGCLIAPNPAAIRANFGSAIAFLGAGSNVNSWCRRVRGRDGGCALLSRRVGERHLRGGRGSQSQARSSARARLWNRRGDCALSPYQRRLPLSAAGQGMRTRRVSGAESRTPPAIASPPPRCRWCGEARARGSPRSS